MSLMTMQFKSFIWPDNPAQVEVKEERRIQTRLIPFSQENSENLGMLCRRVSGKGHFTGDSGLQNFRSLEAVFHEGSAGSLQLPGLLPFRAVMESLTLIGNAGSRAIEYTFSFVEQKEETAEKTKQRLAAAGESLWEYAQRFDVNVDKLIALNLHIRDIAELKQGEKVVLS